MRASPLLARGSQYLRSGHAWAQVRHIRAYAGTHARPQQSRAAPSNPQLPRVHLRARHAFCVVAASQRPGDESSSNSADGGSGSGSNGSEGSSGGGAGGGAPQENGAQQEAIGRGSLKPDTPDPSQDGSEGSMTYREMLAQWYYTRCSPTQHRKGVYVSSSLRDS